MFLIIFLNGCSKILEPVSLLASKQGVETENVQENFNINVKSLTFSSAQKANNAPYPRQLMLTGIGDGAKLVDEADFITSSTPPMSGPTDYLLGIGDELLFTQQYKFAETTTEFPDEEIETEYLVGIGDELNLIQLNETTISNINTVIALGENKVNDSVINTKGIVGSNGNILLLGIGNIKAKNRSLNELQTEVRNILIRNGQAPNFQLNISGFNSKKAFMTFPSQSANFGENIIPITNNPITLKEVCINYGLRPSSNDSNIITLTRGRQNFRITAGQLFDKKFPRIVIKDKDQIEIDETASNPVINNAIVGSQGNILLPKIGSIKAEGLTLSELQGSITRTLKQMNLIPRFQLEITKFKSKKYFLISGNPNGVPVVALDNSKLSLKNAIISNGFIINNNKIFTMVELTRNARTYQMTLQDVLNSSKPIAYIQDGDIIKIQAFEYKPSKVFTLSGAGNARLLPIDPSKRETLADVLFTPDGALNNLLAKRSEVYLLRGRNPSLAYHLDAQNVSRILVAAKTELRPNDIVYVSERPIISFSRTLSEISPLRTLLRDIQSGNIP